MTQVQLDAIAQQENEEYYLNTHPTLIDVRDDPEYRKKDIDFINNNGISVELKSGTTVSQWGNIPVEFQQTFYSNHNGDIVAGWLYKSHADYVVYYDIVQHYEYVMSLPALRAYVYNRIDIDKTICYHKVRNTDYRKELTAFYALSVSELIDAGIIVYKGEL